VSAYFLRLASTRFDLEPKMTLLESLLLTSLSVCLSILHRLSVCLRVTVRHQNILVNKFCYIKHTFKGDRRCKLRTLCAVANDAYQRSLIVSIHQDNTLMFCFMDVVRTTAGV